MSGLVWRTSEKSCPDEGIKAKAFHPKRYTHLPLHVRQENQEMPIVSTIFCPFANRGTLGIVLTVGLSASVDTRGKGLSIGSRCPTFQASDSRPHSI